MLGAALVRGLRWSLHYYLHGTPSWQWFFPYHHAPLIIDVAALLAIMPSVSSSPWLPSRPMRPFEQLLMTWREAGCHERFEFGQGELAVSVCVARGRIKPRFWVGCESTQEANWSFILQFLGVNF